MAKQMKFEVNYFKNKKILLEELDKPLSLEKSENMDQTEEKDKIVYSPFAIKGLQSYNPVYSNFFTMTDKNYDQIALNNRYQFRSLNKVFDIQNSKELSLEKDAFVKFAPLLDPIRYLIGKYKDKNDLLRTLPNLNSDSKNCLEKYLNYNNCSYTDNFFCYLSSQLLNVHKFSNSIDYYGSYLGIQEKYKMNLLDDIEYLNQSDYFLKHKDIMYEMEKLENPFANFGSRNNKNKLVIHNGSNCSIVLDDDIMEVLDIEEMDEREGKEENLPIEIEETYHKPDSKNSTESSNSSNNSEVNYSDFDPNEEESDSGETGSSESDSDEEEDSEELEEDEEDSEEKESDESEEEEEETLFGYIKDFPVQMICIEKCSGTIDQLFDKGEIDEDNGASALFQVVMSLLAYQKAFHFTHNDLHTNNIMYTNTEEEFIYYKYDEVVYKVPTYGKIFKLIDFGRAIYKFQGKTYCSDSFAPGGDAATQYNFEPFFNEKKPRLEPNYAFDLCRLGCSIYDFVLEEEDVNTKEGLEELDDLQRLVLKWVTDDNKRNVLYKRDGEERYPGFKLYKMIARTVHQPTPIAQLQEPFFKKFECSKKEQKEIDASTHIIDLDQLPVYV